MANGIIQSFIQNNVRQDLLRPLSRVWIIAQQRTDCIGVV